VASPFGGGVQVGLDDREVGESLEGAPAAGGALLDFLGADGAFGFIVCRWCEGVANCWIVSSKCLNRVMRVWVCRVGGVFVLVVGVASASAPWLRLWMRCRMLGWRVSVARVRVWVARSWASSRVLAVAVAQGRPSGSASEIDRRSRNGWAPHHACAVSVRWL
jgi:hypothetical protein